MFILQHFDDQWHYLLHLLVWMLPVFLLQWLIGWKIFLHNWKPVLLVPLILGTYLILTDMVAVAQGVWFFDSNQILGFSPGGVPIEEWLFFYLTSALVVQSFLLFLPVRYREPQLSQGTDPSA